MKQIDKAMMDELKDVKRVLNPTEVLLVVDAMTGQEAAGIQKWSLKYLLFYIKKIIFFFIKINCLYLLNIFFTTKLV